MINRRATIAIICSSMAVAILSAPTIALAETPSTADIIIGEIEKRILQDYFDRQVHDWQATPGTGTNKGKKNKGLPPGLAKREHLPPGLEKQLVRNGHLPPGLEYRDLPDDLQRRLPALPANYRYVMADNRVMLIQRATNLIMDVIEVAAIDALD